VQKVQAVIINIHLGFGLANFGYFNPFNKGQIQYP